MLQHTRVAACCLLLVAGLSGGARAEKIPYAKLRIKPPTPEWTARIQELAPAKPTVDCRRGGRCSSSRFSPASSMTLFRTSIAFSRSSARSPPRFDATRTVDIEALSPGRLAAYDVLVLNNNCSIGPRRNLFLDELERNPRYRGMTEKQRQTKADALEQSILDFVAGGKGLVAIHGAPTMLNNSAKFTEMVGGSVLLPSAESGSDAPHGQRRSSAAGGIPRQGAVHPPR